MKTEALLKESGFEDLDKALKELIRLQRLTKARSAVLKVEPPDELSRPIDFEVHGDQFVVIRFSRVIDASRAQQISEQTGLPVIMLHELEGIDLSLVRLEPMKKPEPRKPI